MILILAVGQRQPAWVNDAVADYLNRFPKNQRPQIREIKAESRTSGRPVTALMQAEADRLRAALPKSSVVISLDEHGQDLTTTELTQLISKIEQTGEHLVFLIGGPDGLDQNLKAASQYCLRISSMTLPHGLARILLVEQLYRMQSLKMNHPYHRSEVS